MFISKRRKHYCKPTAFRWQHYMCVVTGEHQQQCSTRNFTDHQKNGGRGGEGGGEAMNKSVTDVEEG